MSPEKTLIAFFYPAANNELLKRALHSGANISAIDMVPRISRAQKMNGKDRGYRAVIEASANFRCFFTGQITARYFYGLLSFTSP
ncbi:hypothetical protein CO655_30965 [Rhizobium sp. M1]|nr:hypothetical protein CO655_30965 [Rhizobium sp. M1]